MNAKNTQIKAYVAIVWFCLVFAQTFGAEHGTDGEIRQIHIGEVVPDVPLENLLNHQGSEVTLSTFSSRLLLIEFWDVYCASCIAGFPKLERLQRLFGDSISVLLVTKSSEEQVRQLMERSAIARNCELPMVVGDRNLSSYFHYQTVPAYAWIDAGGTLRHFSSAYTFLEENHIRDFINGLPLDMPRKDEYGDFKVGESLITEGGGRNLRLLQYYSLITGRTNYDNQVAVMLRDTLTRAINGVHFVNYTIPELFRHAYADSLISFGRKPGKKQVEWDIRDPTRFLFDASSGKDIQSWLKDHTYCYENRIPAHLDERAIFEVMQRDLQLFFKLKVKVSSQPRPCLILKSLQRDDGLGKLESGGGTMKVQYPYRGADIHIRNAPFVSLFNALEMLLTTPDGDVILLNEAGIPDRLAVDAELSAGTRDIAELNIQLAGLGLTLVEEVRPIRRLLIYE